VDRLYLFFIKKVGIDMNSDANEKGHVRCTLI
jgi:hypothetical protein